MQLKPSIGFFSKFFKAYVLVSTIYSNLAEVLFSANDTTSYLGAIVIGAPAPGVYSLTFFGPSIYFIYRGKTYATVLPIANFFSLASIFIKGFI